MTKINFETAGLILSNVPDHKKFICNDGSVFVNLEELMIGLKTINKETFDYHVNEDKNDFSSWIYDVVGDVKLSKNVRTVKDANSAAKKIKVRITYLKKTMNEDS